MKQTLSGIALLILLAISLFLQNSQNENFVQAKIKPGKDEMVLAEKSYINFAWGFQYKGTVILTNGSIYRFDAGSQRERIMKCRTAKDYSSLILDNLTEKASIVPQKDLEKIKKQAGNIKEKLQEKSAANDAGSTSVKIYNYTENRQILLDEKGDWIRKNTDKTAGELLKTINKYIR